MTDIHVGSQAEAYRWLKDDHAKRVGDAGWKPLAYGVGNDMSGPFYTARRMRRYEYYPSGLPGPLVYVTWGKD